MRLKTTEADRLLSRGSAYFGTIEKRDAFVAKHFGGVGIKQDLVSVYDEYRTIEPDGYLAVRASNDYSKGGAVYWKAPTTARRPEWLDAWIEKGRANPWIKEADDPAFDERSFRFCATRDELLDFIDEDNWSVGTAFTLGDLCFINQNIQPNEWLVIRRDISFESLTYGWMGDTAEKRRAKFGLILDAIDKATDEQLRTSSYLPPDDASDDSVVLCTSAAEVRNALRGGTNAE